MAIGIEFRQVTKRYGDAQVAAGRQGHRPGRAQGHADHHPRPLGLRQDDQLRMIAGLDAPSCGPDPHRRPGRDHARPGRAQRQHGVPELRAVPAHERDRPTSATGWWCRACRKAGGRAARARGDGQRRPGRLRQAPAERAVGRPAAARGGGARAGAGAVGDAVRRAAVEPRRAPAPQHARGNPRAAAAPEADGGLRHARPERGAGRQRPDHRDGRRPHRAGRHAAAAVRAPEQRVRRRLHGRGHAVRRPGAGRRQVQLGPLRVAAAAAGGGGAGEGGRAARGLAAERPTPPRRHAAWPARCRNAPTWAASRS